MTYSAPKVHELVILDCDGVLVDSEPIANRLVAETLAREGLTLTTGETMRRYMGRFIAACRGMIEAELGRRCPRDSSLNSASARFVPFASVPARRQPGP